MLLPHAIIRVLNLQFLIRVPSLIFSRPFSIFFTECKTLTAVLILLTHVFCLFGEKFSQTSFIFGVDYKKANQIKWQLPHFLSG